MHGLMRGVGARRLMPHETGIMGSLDETTLAMIDRFNETHDDGDDDATPLILAPRLAPSALHGVLGEYVRAIEPHTEAHPAGILASLLVATSVLIGRGPYQQLDNRRHAGNLFALIVGPSADGRKGTAVSAAQALLALTDKEFSRANIANGLASGQGLLYRLRDARLGGATIGGATRGVAALDPGVLDKRLLAIEEEFGQQFRLMSGRENTLSTTLRTAWDGGTLQSLTRGEPLMVTDPHVGLIAQITAEELDAVAGPVEYTSGFLNRFLFVYVKRTKMLPFASALPMSELDAFAERLRNVVENARRVGEVLLGTAARAKWEIAYASLTMGASGRLGNVTRRGAPIVRRLAMQYALLDGSHTIEPIHLDAALAIWNYSVDSARYLYRRSPGLTGLAARLLTALRAAGLAGLDKTGLWKAGGSHNRKSTEINNALEELRTAGLADVTELTATGGRPRQVWHGSEFMLGQPREYGKNGGDGN